MRYPYKGGVSLSLNKVYRKDMRGGISLQPASRFSNSAFDLQYRSSLICRKHHYQSSCLTQLNSVFGQDASLNIHQCFSGEQCAGHCRKPGRRSVKSTKHCPKQEITPVLHFNQDLTFSPRIPRTEGKLLYIARRGKGRKYCDGCHPKQLKQGRTQNPLTAEAGGGLWTWSGASPARSEQPSNTTRNYVPFPLKTTFSALPSSIPS